MADYSKLQQATGWEPTIDFAEGVQRVCEPYMNA
jgi:UDP-glucose 4-epimerase